MTLDFKALNPYKMEKMEEQLWLEKTSKVDLSGHKKTIIKVT